ncbi:MAG: peptidase M3, partial [Bacteroidaceae bacterium]|nr:peptidase M3 [Bacteroidaceae bacterium]
MSPNQQRKNPFFEPYNTPHGTVPFPLIRLEDYEPAILEGIRQAEAEVDAIINNPDEATFENTIVALEQSGSLLGRVTTVMYNLMSAETCDELDELANKMQPALSEHSNNIGLNEKLFARIKAVHDSHPQLDAEEAMLLEKTYKGFCRRGANLNEEQKQQLRQLTLESSQCALKFQQNSLKETNAYMLHVTEASRLEGMPETELEAAEQTAKEKGLDGWVFTLQAPSYSGLMTYCKDRELRQELYTAYNTKCTHGGDTDNQQLVCQLVNLRQQIAQLLGYDTYASYALEMRMAENEQQVFQLLNQLLEAYRPKAEEEVREVEETARKREGEAFRLMPWDWSYYSHILKLEKYNL